MTLKSDVKYKNGHLIIKNQCGNASINLDTYRRHMGTVYEDLLENKHVFIIIKKSRGQYYINSLEHQLNYDDVELYSNHETFRINKKELISELDKYFNRKLDYSCVIS